MNIEELRERYAALKEKRDNLVTEKAKLESRRDVAQESYDKTMEKLKKEFDVDTLEEAKEMYQREKAEIEESVAKCELELQL